MPLISIVSFLLFLLIPKIDPLKKNIEKFRKYYDYFILIIILFLFYLYLLMLAWNLGARFAMGKFLIPALAALIYYAGILISNAKPNWFIGIRTPWTLSSKSVWEKTHRFGGKLFRAAAIINLAGMIFYNLAFWITIVSVAFTALILLVYSCFEYQKEKSKKA